MSFGTYARKVRDPALAYGQRINALAGCVRLYCPIGYLATFGFLREIAGPVRRDEEAMVRALDALTTSRVLWLRKVDAYADRRRAEKRLGRRRPGADEMSPHWPACWYGDEQRAALFALRFALQRPTPWADLEVVRLAFAVLEGEPAVADREQLTALRERFERLRDASGWPIMDMDELHRANESLGILRHIANAVGTSGER